MTMIDLTDAGRKIAALSWGRPEGGEWNTRSLSAIRGNA